MDTGGSFSPKPPFKKLDDPWVGDSLAQEGATLLDTFALAAMIAIIQTQGIVSTLETQAYDLAGRMITEKRSRESQ